jgi:hypothetical protein
VGDQLGGFRKQGSIQIEDGGLTFLGKAGGLGEKDGAGGSLPVGVGVGKVGANIARGESAEDSIGEGMKKDIGIAVTVETEVVGNGDTAEDQGAARNQRMNVVTHAHTQHGKIMSSGEG